VGHYGDYLAAFLIAGFASYLLTFPVRRIALRTGAVDQPGELRIHDRPLPVIGGAAMCAAFAIAIVVSGQLPQLTQIFKDSYEPAGVILAGFVVYLVGLIDDVREISAPAKVAGQVLAAMVLVVLGVTMYYFKLPFDSHLITLSASALPLVTAAWVVGMTNAVNLIDGLDGLAAGIVAIASGSLCVYGIWLIHLGDLPSNNLGPLVAAVTCGVAIGFLPHNFHPAKIIMGDGGALFLGLQMAAATMLIGGRAANPDASHGLDVSGLTFFRFAPLFIPFVILGVPIIDMCFAIIRRTARRSSFAERDLGHLHHRLIRLGHGHRRAVLILWAWTAVLSAFVLLPVLDSSANAFVPIGVGVLGVALYTVFRPAGTSPDAMARRQHHPVEGGAPGGAIDHPETTESTVPVIVSGGIGHAIAGERDLSFESRPPRRAHSSRRRTRLLRTTQVTTTEQIRTGDSDNEMGG
jgi:UDP-GlcNAc:undecaprenyl-phosphate GlcNAc-1-phosphate transferase